MAVTLFCSFDLFFFFFDEKVDDLLVIIILLNFVFEFKILFFFFNIVCQLYFLKILKSGNTKFGNLITTFVSSSNVNKSLPS